MSALTPGFKSYQECDYDGPFTEDKFHAGSSVKDGVSGKATFDSTYENLRGEEVINSRSNNELKEDDDLKKGCSTKR
jgi:hypothetical protein